MAVAFDAFSASGAPAVDPSWTHTPVGTPRGVLVFVGHPTSESIVSITYGGVAMSLDSSFANSVGGELAGQTIDAWFLGASIPTGGQTVAINGGASSIVGYAYTVTAAADTEVVDTSGTESASISDVSVTVSLGGRTCFVAENWASGEDAVGSVSPLASWTSRSESDFGAITGGSYSYDTIDTADVTAGLTQSTDDVLLFAAAVSEVVAGGAAVSIVPLVQNYRNMGLMQ